MSVFAIVLKEPNEQVLERLEVEYPDNFRLGRTFALVRSDDLTDKVAKKAGIKGRDGIPDVSVALFMLRGTYCGYTDRSLWEWSERHEDHF